MDTPTASNDTKPSIKTKNITPKTTKTTKKKYKGLTDFLISHISSKKDGDETKQPTHTRIGNEASGIKGGSYHIADDEYTTFMNLYYNEIIAKKGIEYLTEKQLTSTNSPIAVDIDMHFPFDTMERFYTSEHVEDFVDVYLAELTDIFQFDVQSNFNIYIFEKATVNRVAEKNITKDGIHMIIGIQMDHIAQRLLRSNVIPKIAECWSDFNLMNSWTDVFDEGITIGYTNFQLIGSRKPNHDCYELTKVFEISFDDDGEYINTPGNPKEYMTAEKFTQLSVRYPNHPSFFYKSAFLQKLSSFQNGTGNAMSRATSNATLPNVDLIQNADETSGMDVSKIRNQEDLDTCVHHFLDTIAAREYILREMYEYTMVLPESYYGTGSYAKWIRVGWALKNTSNRLLIVWIAFSARSSTFSYSDIPDLCNQWAKFDRKNSGVTNRSIIYWAIHDNAEGASSVRKNTISYYLDQTINTVTLFNLNNPTKNGKGCGDYDIAVVLHQMYKDEYVCSDIGHGIWYQFRNHRWRKIDSGTYLRRAISNELRDLYENRASELQNYAATLDQEDEKYKHVTERVKTILKIIMRLGNTSDKKNIMQEARDLFYDSEFHNRLDSKPYLLCCKNGVLDFKEKVLRKGLPEDYLTKCTNINYHPTTSSKHTGNIDEINDFMAKLFPDPELRNYMWDHCAEVLIGMPSINQTLNNYVGFGQNGKSVFTDLMSQTLGEYKVGGPMSLITQPRTRVGGLSPEIVALQGARYVVLQEPSKNDVINDGPMKELVSGVEPISARAPYMLEMVTFIPQCKIIVCANELMGVKTRDHGTWRRIRVVPFVSLFTENPVEGDPEKPYQYKLDRNLKDKFPVWRETFLAMLAERAFVTQGTVKDCDAVLAASNEYRERQDYLSEFIRDKVVRMAGSTIRKAHLSDEFKLWYNVNFGGRPPSPKELHDLMDKQYGKNKGGVWAGVKLKFNNDEEVLVDDSEEEELLDVNL
jgi:P4 family phage/plasmid primase-like protien